MKRAVLFAPLLAAMIGFGSLAAACDDEDDDTIGENIDEALETVEQGADDIGDEVGEEIDDLGDDDETPTP
jgi:hypothetical protein